MNKNQEKTFTFDELPDNNKTSLDEGVHKLTIISAEQVYAKTGTLMFQLAYNIDDNANLKLQYDNCPLIDANGNTIAFGQNKLKKIMKATNVMPQRFTLSIIKPLLIGKSFNVFLSKNEKGYLVIDASNIDTIKPLTENTNEEVIISNKETVSPIDFVEDNDIDWN